MVFDQPKRRLEGSYHSSEDRISINIVGCSAWDAENLERIIGEVTTQHLKVQKLGKDFSDQYLTVWSDGKGFWGDKGASFLGERDDYGKDFSRVGVEANFPGADKIIEKIKEQYDFFPSTRRSY